MRSTLMLAAAAATLVCALPARAAESLKVYDRFNEAPLDPSRWIEGDRARFVKGGGLHLMQRNWSPTGADVGLTFQSWNSNLTNPTTVTSLRARITVNSLEANACASNPAIAESRARIVGTFFNVGTPTPGSQVGDALGQVKLTRLSNSADPAGVLRVQGILSICTTVDCAGAATVGNIVDLGTATIGTPTVVTMQWDKGGKTFTFSRDNGAAIGTVAYAQSDANPPGVAFQQLSTRINLPNCQSAPRVGSLVDARFDNVFVNQLALP